MGGACQGVAGQWGAVLLVMCVRVRVLLVVGVRVRVLLVCVL